MHVLVLCSWHDIYITLVLLLIPTVVAIHIVNMSETQEAILANAAYHARLLTAIGQLEYVPSAKKHQISYIEDLDGQLATIQKEVAQLAEKTKKERKEHETLRDSTSRRFAHKLLGKAEQYEAKANKEER